MKKFYYFSEKSLNFLEIKHFREKLTAIFIASLLLFSSILLGIFYLLTNNYDKDQYLSLLNENQRLKNKITTFSNNYSNLENQLNDLTKISNDLRLAANLEPINIEERLLGTGGSNKVDNLFTGLGQSVANATIVIDEVTRRFEFEKTQFNEISTKLKLNTALFESIPAIIPCDGQYSSESFGMRLHPILKIYKMHNGIDILNSVGTPVKATGNGRVTFVGTESGFGLAVKIDHGFRYQTVYAHLSSTLVSEGQKVKRGDLIAKSGNSGLSTGPHLHYEVLHDGQNLNPADFFFDEYNYFESTYSK